MPTLVGCVCVCSCRVGTVNLAKRKSIISLARKKKLHTTLYIHAHPTNIGTARVFALLLCVQYSIISCARCRLIPGDYTHPPSTLRLPMNHGLLFLLCEVLPGGSASTCNKGGGFLTSREDVCKKRMMLPSGRRFGPITTFLVTPQKKKKLTEANFFSFWKKNASLFFHTYLADKQAYLLA